MISYNVKIPSSNKTLIKLIKSYIIEFAVNGITKIS
jgi:hypothetical protein